MRHASTAFSFLTPWRWAMRASLLKLFLVSAVCVTIIVTTFLARWAQSGRTLMWDLRIGSTPAWTTVLLAYGVGIGYVTVCTVIAYRAHAAQSTMLVPSHHARSRVVRVMQGLLWSNVLCSVPSVVLLPWQICSGKASNIYFYPPPFWTYLDFPWKQLGSESALAFLAALILLITAWSVHRALRPPRHDRCTHCDYDLTNLQSQTCPECNTPIKKL